MSACGSGWIWWRLAVAVPLVAWCAFAIWALTAGVSSGYVEVVLLLALVAAVALFLPGRHPLLWAVVLVGAVLLIILWYVAHQGATLYQARHPDISYALHDAAVWAGGAVCLYLLVLASLRLRREPGLARESFTVDRFMGTPSDAFGQPTLLVKSPAAPAKPAEPEHGFAEGSTGRKQPDELAP